jgi:mannosyltransferase
VVLLLLAGALVLQRRSLWYDELFTAQVGTAGPAALARAVRTGEGTASYLLDVPPSYNAPYYVVVQAWLAVTGLPADEVGLRLLSLLAAVAGVAVLTVAVTRLAGRAAGLTAGLVTATSPMVVEYAAEARGYGLALLATATAVLGLSRWLDDGRLGLWAVGALAAGLAHWFALPVVAGLALAGLVLRRRAALGLLAVAALAALPTLGLVALVVLNGTGDSAVGWIRDTGGAVPVLALQAWSGSSRLLLPAVLLAAAVGLVRGDRRTAVVAACWVVVPLAAVTAAELLRPVFVPRYLLPALVGLAVLAGTGLSRLPRPAAVAATGALVVLQLLAVADVAGRGPREDARGAVQALQAAAAARGARRGGRPPGRARAWSSTADGWRRTCGCRRTTRRRRTSCGCCGSRSASGSGRRRRRAARQEGLVLRGSRVFRGTSSDLVLQRWSR